MIRWIKTKIGWEHLSQIQRFRVAKIYFGIMKIVLRLGAALGWHMNTLAMLARTDKFGVHRYTEVYDSLFRPIRKKRLTLLEIGVGGHSHRPGGGSLALWRSFFPRARIVAIDIYDKTHLSQGRVTVFQCSQTDHDGLKKIVNIYGGFDIIVDDGSHLNEHQIETFQTLFPSLHDEGFYVIEDVQTSYWPAFGGGQPGSAGYERSAMHFFKSLCDGINWIEFLDEKYQPSDYDKKIKSIHFCHNLVIIRKGENTERSDLVESHRSSLLTGRTVDGTISD